MALPLADESGLSRNCSEAAGLPPATLKALKKNNMTCCLGTGQQAQTLYDDEVSEHVSAIYLTVM
jgi:hypothetical protein